MAVKFRVKIDQPAALETIREKREQVTTAAVAALREVAAGAVQEGRRNIAAAGPGFSKAQWQSGLQYRTRNARSLRATATIFHRYGIAGVFEYGATIQGKPMLWIPTKHGAPTASKSGKELTSATVRGQPMLFDANDPARDRKPLYIGVPSVTIPKKFRIVEIVKEQVKRFAELFHSHLKNN